MTKPNKKAILIFGAFNPVTLAHIEMGVYARAYVGRDADVIYIPASRQYLDKKSANNGDLFSDVERLIMLKYAVEPYGFLVYDKEMYGCVSGKAYDTVQDLKSFAFSFSYEDIYIVLGEDNFRDLPNWYKAEELMNENNFIIFSRNEEGTCIRLDGDFLNACENPSKWVFLPSLMNISSTEVRNAFVDGKLREVKGFLPQLAYEFLQKKYNKTFFDAKTVKNKLVDWIKNWFDENGPDCNAVVGISGGVDSSVVAALCVEALGKDRVVGILMPNGEQKDISDSLCLVKHLGIQSIECDIKQAVNSVLDSIVYGVYNNTAQGEEVGLEMSKQTTMNLPPRIRMATLYAISQSMNGRVMNTSNLSESWVGWDTRYGDSVGDCSPLGNLTKTEIRQIAKELGLPEQLANKTPIDGLCGKTDEESFGFTYEVLDRYIRTGLIEDESIRANIDEKHRRNLFKLQPMPSPDFPFNKK